MSNYTKSTNFATKDNLPTGDPLKIVKGTEIDTEYNNIATAIATKTDNASAAITGGTIVGITDLAIADGGTGASTATAALNNLLPSQTSAANKYLQSDGTNASWDAVTLSTSDITGTLAVANGGTGVTSSTGTGSVVLSNSPTLVTPTLGAASATSLSVSGSVTLSGGTANAVPYLNGSKVLTSSTALYFDGSNLGVGGSASYRVDLGSATSDDAAVGIRIGRGGDSNSWTLIDSVGGATNYRTFNVGTPTARWLTSTNGTSFTEQMRLNPTGLGIKNNNPAAALDVTGSALVSGSVTAASFSGALNGTVGATTASTGAFTTLTTSSTVTHNGGTANGVTYLNGSKVLTSGSALTFNGTDFATTGNISSGTAKSISLNASSTADVTRLKWNYDGTTYAWIERVNSSGDMAFGVQSSEGMRLTSTGLGIGTSSPSQKLSVAGNGTFTGYVTTGGGGNGLRVDGVLMADRDQDNNITLIGGSDNTLRLRTGSTTRATLDTSGNLGLGVTPSAWSGIGPVLELKGNAYIASTTQVLSLVTNSYYNGTNWIYKTTNPANRYDTIFGEHRWYNAASGTAGNAITFTQAMTLDADGRLGIGNTSPSTLLDVLANGNKNSAHFSPASNTDSGGYLNATGNSELMLSGGASYNSYSSPNFVMNAKSTSASGIYLSGDAVKFWVNTGLTAGTTFNQTERARIDSSGNFGIGTSSPSYPLDIGTSQSAETIARVLNSSTNSSAASVFRVQNSASNLDVAIRSTGASAFNALDAGSAYFGYNGTTSLVLYSSNASGVIKFATNTTERARIPAAGGFQSVGSISVGNATPTTSGAGITFPATQSASSNANTLDDYEEGTWTPTIIGTTTAGTGTYTTQVGSYTKIGNQVTLDLTLTWTAHTGTGNMRISGLPFTVGSYLSAGSVGLCDGISLTASNFMSVYSLAAEARLSLVQNPVGGGTATGIPMDTAAGPLVISISYTV